MICDNSKELLAEIKKYMDINEISMKELSIASKKSQQSVSQIFQKGNPKLNTIFEILDALNIKLNIIFEKGDTE